MYYTIAIIILNSVFISMLVYNKIIQNENKSNEENFYKFEEDVYTPKAELLIPGMGIVMWANFCILALVFIGSRIYLSQYKSDNEYKKQEIVFQSGHIQRDGGNYIMYINNKLETIPIHRMDITVDENASAPYIENYFTRWTKKAVPNPNRFLLFNRKVDSFGDWVSLSVGSTCGCNNYTYKLVLDKQLDIKHITND